MRLTPFLDRMLSWQFKGTCWVVCLEGAANDRRVAGEIQEQEAHLAARFDYTLFHDQVVYQILMNSATLLVTARGSDRLLDMSAMKQSHGNKLVVVTITADTHAIASIVKSQ